MLSKKPEVKDLLMDHIYLKYIFKIIYTAIFCMHTSHIAHFQSLIHEIITYLVRTMFRGEEEKMKPPKFFDSTEIVGNFKDFLSDLVLNLSTVEIPLL